MSDRLNNVFSAVSGFLAGSATDFFGSAAVSGMTNMNTDLVTISAAIFGYVSLIGTTVLAVATDCSDDGATFKSKKALIGVGTGLVAPFLLASYIGSQNPESFNANATPVENTPVTARLNPSNIDAQNANVALAEKPNPLKLVA